MLDIEDINEHTNNEELFKIYSEIILELINWVTNYNADVSKLKNKFTKS